jgi:hypothetical protein
MAVNLKEALSRSATTEANDEAVPHATVIENPQPALAHWLQGSFAFWQEIAQFTQNRLQEDMAAWVALSACRSPQDAANCQRHFAERMIAEYGAEIKRLAQMMMPAAGTSLSARQNKPPAA